MVSTLALAFRFKSNGAAAVWHRPIPSGAVLSRLGGGKRFAVLGSAVKVGFPIKPPDYIRGETAARGAGRQLLRVG